MKVKNGKKGKKVKCLVVKLSCGNGGGCSIQPYILPYGIVKAA